MNSQNKKLCIITGYSSTGKTFLTYSGFFDDFLNFPMHLIQSLSSFEDDKIKNLCDSKFLDILENKESWKVSNGKMYCRVHKKVFDLYDYRDGPIDIDFLRDLTIKALKKWSGHDILIEGEYVSRRSVLKMLVIIAKELKMDVYVAVLHDKYKVIDKRYYKKYGAHVSPIQHKELTKRLLKMVCGMLPKSEITGLLIGRVEDLIQSGKKNGIFKLFEQSKQEGE